MKIQAGKRYVMRYGGITAPMNQNGDNTHGYYWTDGYEFWCKNGLWNLEEDRRDIIAEYIPQPESLPFELKAGERYELDNGEVVKLEQADLRKGFRKHFPFAVCGKSYSLFVMVTGELMHGDDPEYSARIVRPYVEPPKQTVIDRLWELQSRIYNCGLERIANEMSMVLADLKATVKP